MRVLILRVQSNKKLRKGKKTDFTFSKIVSLRENQSNGAQMKYKKFNLNEKCRKNCNI